MKHVTTCIVALLSCFTVLSAQVKKTYKDANHKHQTVVIKTSEDDNDLDILDDQFDIDKFQVGQVVKITTEKPIEAKKGKPATELSSSKRKVRIKKNRVVENKFKGRSLGGKRKKDKKPSLVYNDPPKRKKGKDYSKKCYKFK